MPRIPLPPATQNGEAKAHPFPIQIGYQTLEFLHGAIFYATVTDLATGAYIKHHQGRAKLEEHMESLGLEVDAHAKGWEILQKYESIFTSLPFQSVLVSLCSHWDWYVRRLSGFIRAGRTHLGELPLTKDQEQKLKRADRLPLNEQLQILSTASGVDFDLTESDINLLYEMSLVRNLGLHNRWEVDDTYLSQSQSTSYSVGDIRDLSSSELGQWHKLLIKLINHSSINVAIKYVGAPASEI
jgi:hypothetical protein